MVTWPALPQLRRACGDALALRGRCQLRVRVFPRPADGTCARARALAERAREVCAHRGVPQDPELLVRRADPDEPVIVAEGRESWF